MNKRKQLTKRQIEKLFPGVHPMLRERAGAFARQSGQHFDDTLTQAYFGFMQAIEKWSPEKAVKFSTWVYRKVTCHLMYCRAKKFSERLQFYDEIKEEMTEEFNPGPAAYRESIMDRIRDLSPEAQKMVKYLLNTDKPDGELDPKELFQEACDHLSFEHGFDDTQLQIAKIDIQMALMET